jgi:hypothetical protein
MAPHSQWYVHSLPVSSFCVIWLPRVARDGRARLRMASWEGPWRV